MIKVYICGKVSGEPREEVEQKFNDAAQLLTDNNYDPVNPIAMVPEDTTWESAMKICISEMLKCSHIYLISDWRQSRGGRIEYQLSKDVKIIRIYKENLCQI